MFAVGDDEQSIYAWAGADPRAFTSFINDFSLTSPIYLGENRRCPRHIFDLARRLIENNPPIFDDFFNPDLALRVQFRRKRFTLQVRARMVVSNAAAVRDAT